MINKKFLESIIIHNTFPTKQRTKRTHNYIHKTWAFWPTKKDTHTLRKHFSILVLSSPPKSFYVFLFTSDVCQFNHILRPQDIPSWFQFKEDIYFLHLYSILVFDMLIYIVFICIGILLHFTLLYKMILEAVLLCKSVNDSEVK